MRHPLAAACLLLLLPYGSALHAREAAKLAVPPSGVIGVEQAQLNPAFWIRQAPDADAVVLDTKAIAARNATLFKVDPSMHDLHALPKTIDRAQVLKWIGDVSKRPTRTLYDEAGQPVPAATIDAQLAALALDKVPDAQKTRFGLVVRRAALRSFPTALRVFSRQGDTDIDRFQETAEFPGTPVAIVHASADGRWLFVVSPRYAAWVERDAVAEGAREQVLAYADQAPYRVITGAVERTVYTREQPGVSQLALDMGVRVPLAQGLAPDQPVNGQHAYSSYALELPIRQADGSLAFSPALLQKHTDSSADYLPLTRANLIRQAFKFLGERYGWGHAYDARDCSGFVSDVYRSMGVQMPRNTSAQAVSPGLDHTAFTEQDGREVRERAVEQLQVGDLIYIPGHVMMMLGRIDGEPYVIHDTQGLSYRDGGAMRRVKLNEVSVTPLRPLMFNDRQSYIDRMTSIVRIR
ncbi:SH3 domain-containing protein [Dyella sp. BiH032]|uniref:C40 family peptidase n=1 Tax=Dyella sp. BiH032 TaxID=3075430 RepID=UPI002892F65B|nr:SH3 domain-containing protein [Dyella sp. BiH032]WNL46869.1 SH3 domain-containing protein [Dyella sp. BiH032]